MNKHLVAVYGSLLSGLGNHSVIQGENTEFLGEFKSEPVYKLYTLGGFPGLKEDGDTSVIMEVYSVDDDVAKSVDWLEGYDSSRPATFYDKKSIETPWGTASVYIYVDDIDDDQLVESGDWRQFVKERNNAYAY